MLEGLARQRIEQVRALDLEFAVHGLSVYGLASLMAALDVPGAISAPLALALGGACAFRWLQRRWQAESLDPQG